MPPRNNPRAKKDAERRKKILSTKEKILSIKRMLLAIIEAMIEKDISKEWFLTNCTKLCHADYNDVVEERTIEHLCGYPLCSNTMKQTLKQKYHISKVTNKVYDLTERKCFCCNQCYKASNYLRTQLSPIPLYMRKEENIKVHLLSDCENSGSAGEEIVFHHIIPQDEIEKVYNEEQTSTNLSNILNEEVKKCADTLGDLQIKEHVFEKPFVFEVESPKKPEDYFCVDKNESNSGSDVDNNDSEDEKLFPGHDNQVVLSHRHTCMPIREKIKKSVLIPALKHERTTSSPLQELSLDFVFNVFKDWMTEDTMKYLLGEKNVYDIKAEHLFKRITSTDPINPEKQLSLKNEYIKLCLKIDSLPDYDDDDSDSAEIDGICETKISTVSKKVDKDNSTAKKVFKRRPKDKEKLKEKSKHVTFAPEVKASAEEKLEHVVKNSIPVAEMKVPEESPAASSLYNPSFPLVDSVSQNVLRRQILTDNLKSTYSELLPLAGLHYNDIREEIRRFVETLSLTPANIILKPKEWKVISLVLFRILTRTVAKDLHSELKFLKMCKDHIKLVKIDVLKLDKIVSDILCPENILNLQ